jgi:hypothetical protein
VPPSTLVPSLFNVYLRTAPTLSSSITGIVPFDSATSPVARTEDSLWIYVIFDEIEGWGMTELFDISEIQLEALPVYALRPFATRPPVMPESTAEATQEPGAGGN